MSTGSTNDVPTGAFMHWCGSCGREELLDSYDDYEAGHRKPPHAEATPLTKADRWIQAKRNAVQLSHKPQLIAWKFEAMADARTSKFTLTERY